MARRPLPSDENGPQPRRNPSYESRRTIVTMGHNRER